jgi:hypothetical protein
MIRPIVVASLCALLAGCAAQQAARVTLPAAPPPGEPGNVAGLSADQVRLAFGAPAFTRSDGAVEMWRYDGAGCKAFFFLYPGDNGKTVRHVETVPRGADIAADSNCLTGLLKQKTVPVS